MQMTELFAAELEREAAATRRVLERVPEGRNDWKPHDKSMTLGRLATLAATMLGWIGVMVNDDSFDFRPQGKEPFQEPERQTRSELVEALAQSLGRARQALANTTDDHLLTPWRLMVAGNVITERPRYLEIRDSVFNHLAHHRGQLTVYLRLNDAPVPAIYGPSADEPM